jgi:hypothetical protein
MDKYEFFLHLNSYRNFRRIHEILILKIRHNLLALEFHKMTLSTLQQKILGNLCCIETYFCVARVKFIMFKVK